jgi:DNA-binding winged helix-turn-helix (wHTH) protein
MIATSTSESRSVLARFAAFELDVAAGELRRSGRLVALTGQPIRVLTLLVQRAGTIVTRDELRREIWGETHVDFEAGLSTCINQIRTALADRAAAPRFIETLPRRGYRFVAPVAWIAEPGQAQPAVPGVVRARSTRPPRVAARATIAAALALAAVIPLGWAASRSTQTTVPLTMLSMLVDPARNDFQPVSRTLQDALAGALTVEAGDRMRVLSPVAAEAYRDKSLADIHQDGIDYVIYVNLRSAGQSALVHVKLVGTGGWILWTIDRVMTVEELEAAPLALAAEVSKGLVPLMLSAHGSN